MSYRHRPPHPGYGRDGKRLPYLADMSPDAIMMELVGDGAAGHQTKLQRYVDAVQIVAAARGCTVEDVHVEVDQEIKKLTGHTGTEYAQDMARG